MNIMLLMGGLSLACQNNFSIFDVIFVTNNLKSLRSIIDNLFLFFAKRLATMLKTLSAK